MSDPADIRSRAIARLLAREGGYVNHPSDSGEETNWGITVAVARAAGYTGPMREMPSTEAARIYADRYWSPLVLDTVAVLHGGVAETLFDQAVNMGLGQAVEHLQRALNALNARATRWPDLTEDGRMGPATLAALRALFTQRPPVVAGAVLREMLLCQQGAFYLDLSRRREKDEDFVFGWFTRILAAREHG
jgi:lysozyme family protein